MTTEDRNERHKKAMQRRKAIVDEKIAQAQTERGVFIVITGNGKGKTSSAIGTLVRSLGHGFKAGLIQFIKGTQATGETLYLQDDPNLTLHQMKTGFTWETQNRETDITAARETWANVLPLLENPDIQLVVLDEITYMLKYGYLDIEEVLPAILNRPSHQSVIVTGRNAHRDLLENADTVSEIEPVKHAFEAGIKAQAGIEW